jgi:galactokinase
MPDTAAAVSDVTDAFHEQFETAPTTVAHAPGRVNLVGGHVDYNDGIVLPVALDRVTVAAVQPRDDDQIRVHSTTKGETVTATVGDARNDWAAYVVGTATVLADETDATVGADIAVGGIMIEGAGLSSSAALEVAVAGALDDAHDLDCDLKTLADICWRAENEEVGVACGIMDQFASTLGEADAALSIDCRSRNVDVVPFDTAKASILVVDTNVRHELVDSGFNDRVYECREASAKLDALMGKRVRMLRDVSPEEVDAYADQLDEPHYRRARHVTTEIRRVQAASEALRSDDMESLGSLMRESHRSLRDDYEVSCEELNVVVDCLDDRREVYGARMVGGGWGGSVVALVSPTAVDGVAAAVRERYEAETGIECDTYNVSVGDGLTVLEEW